MPIRTLHRRKKLASFLLITSSVLVPACGEKIAESPYTYPETKQPSIHPEVKRVNINSATEEELATLPFIGPKVAAEIVEFRTKYGAFKRPEHLMLIEGISDKRFRAIRHLITVE